MTARIVVVVPVHNEVGSLTRCLSALERAATRTAVPVELVVVLDACSDGSQHLPMARSVFSSVRRIDIEASNVGIARARGFADIEDEDGTWLATTDADSEVPDDWFIRQLSHRARGADAVVGTVVVEDWHLRTTRVRQRYLEHYDNSDGHRHVHGANLSFTAQAYHQVGGFRPLATDEDVAIVSDLSACGRVLHWAGDLPVTTSSRLRGRAPSGFAGYLNGLAEAP